MDAADLVQRATTASLADRGSALVVSLRPRQWTKNLLLFIALAFTLNLQNGALLARAAGAFLCFCALSSAGYLFNDVTDVEADRRHPVKRLRPVAAGLIPPWVALAAAAVLAVVGLGGCFAIRPLLGGVALTYLALTALYTSALKHVVLVDVFGIAAGFVVRAAAGAVAIGVPISPWLYIATMLGALLIGLGKRRAELVSLGDAAAGHRRNLEAYTLPFLDQLILVTSSAVVMTYALYTFSADSLPRNHSFMLTIPVVIYGLFRYLFLLHTGRGGGAPEELLFRDRPLLLAVGIWAVLAVAVLYLGARL